MVILELVKVCLYAGSGSGVISSATCTWWSGWAIDGVDSELGDSEGESGDGEADAGVEDGILGFFGFGGIAGGSHVLDAADDDEYDGDNTEDANDSTDDIADDVFYVAATSATVGIFNWLRNGWAAAKVVGVCWCWEN